MLHIRGTHPACKQHLLLIANIGNFKQSTNFFRKNQIFSHKT